MEVKREYKVIGSPLQLGEGPHWDADKKILYYINLFASEVHSYRPDTEEHYCAKIGEKAVTFILPIENETDKFMISYGGHLEIITWDGKSPNVSRKHYLTLLTDEKTRLNDAKASPSGILFAGSMGTQHADGYYPPGMGKFFAVKNGKAKLLLDKIGLSNGLAWNEDETKLYYNDTLADKTFVFDYNKNTCDISNQKVLLDFIAEKVAGRPDGMTIDRDGNLWSACFGGSQVIKLCSKTGKILERLPIPSTYVTSVAFGGPTCEDLYVTSADHLVPKEEYAQKPNTGCIFKFSNVGARGYPGVPVKL